MIKIFQIIMFLIILYPCLLKADIVSSVYNSDIASVEAAIKSGESINTKDAHGQCMLEVAIRLMNLPIAELLVKNGAKVNDFYQVTTESGKIFYLTPLMVAVTLPNEDYALPIVEMLIKAKADVNLIPKHGYYRQTPLMLAARYGHASICETLIKAGAKINAQDVEYGNTALMKAAMYGRVEVVEVLLKYKANKKIKDKRGDTALQYAQPPYSRESYETVNTIVELLNRK